MSLQLCIASKRASGLPYSSKQDSTSQDSTIALLKQVRKIYGKKSVFLDASDFFPFLKSCFFPLKNRIYS